MILPPYPFAFDETIMFQIGDDSLNSPFRDANLDRDLAQDFGGVLRQQDQDVRVIGKKRPTRLRVFLLGLDVGFRLCCCSWCSQWLPRKRKA